jgi:hypothetical protein
VAFDCSPFVLAASCTAAPAEWPKNANLWVDERGERIAVVIGIEGYERLVEKLEDQEAIGEYQAKTAGEKPEPFDEASARIERNRM